MTARQQDSLTVRKIMGKDEWTDHDLDNWHRISSHIVEHVLIDNLEVDAAIKMNSTIFALASIMSVLCIEEMDDKSVIQTAKLLRQAIQSVREGLHELPDIPVL